MSRSSVESLKIKAKLLQKAKKKLGKPIALKDAFSIIAKASGYPSWKEMKVAHEVADIFNPPNWSAQWKIWFSSHDEALACLQIRGGYLVPYQNQFFVCDESYINSLGIFTDDSDLLKVGIDWSRPRDTKAWEKLVDKIKTFHLQKKQ